MYKFLFFHIVCLMLVFESFAFQINSSTATALNTVTLYNDSTFIDDTGYDYKEGSYFRVINESYYEHPDADQKQKFKWFQVETLDKRKGWVFGDGLAVYVPYKDIASTLQPYHKKKISIGIGFLESTTWIAAIQGRDNFHAQDYMNPLYNEYYLVITNQRGNSVLIKCSGESVRGETDILKVLTKDITGDDFPEFIIQRKTISTENSLTQKEVEIFTMKAGTLSAVFLEHMTLSYETNVPSPALYKQIEIEDQSVRVAYVDYVMPEQYQQDYLLGTVHKRKERCIEYVIVYYTWDKRTKCFKNLYGASRMAPEANLKNGVTYLKSKPQNNSANLVSIYPDEAFCIIKHYEKYVVENGIKKVKNWFYIQTKSKQYGYIPAEKVYFENIEHGTILNRYYSSPPISKLEWTGSENNFLIVH